MLSRQRNDVEGAGAVAEKEPRIFFLILNSPIVEKFSAIGECNPQTGVS